MRARLSIRVCGLLAGTALAALAALGAAAPAARATVSSVAASSASAAGPSGVGAWSAAVENAATGRLLWSRGLNTERPMASITKVMTAYLVIKAGHLDRKIAIPATVTGYVRAHNASNAGLRPGDRLTARQLLYALLLPSGADAAYTLAKAYGPGLSRFVTRMNATARLLGMRRTHFSNFDGLPYPTSYSNYSTAANLLALGRAAMRLPVFRSVVAKRSYRLAAGSGHHAYRWKNLNPLLGRYPGAIGIKPGYTGAAGQCLLFEATRHGHTVIGVTLHSPGSITSVNPADATRILNWAFNHLS
ncbi:MAG TPA: D-alanyl-D-alanine carboxypeptidase [Streptosporangiaceae bacterium]|nr:D-alanyl-D-alanine carboxypeptidase [Streptosporangiaceae bacterium]